MASGGLISDTAAECKLFYEERGKEMMIDFKTQMNRTHTENKKFFDPETKSKGEGFSSNAVKLTIAVNGKFHDVTV